MTRDQRGSLSSLPPEVAAFAREGQRLIEVPRTGRDLAWQIKAYMLGDFGALAGAAIRAESTSGV